MAILCAHLAQTQKPTCTNPHVHISAHSTLAHTWAGHSQDAWPGSAPALSPGLGQAVQQSASEGDRLPLMLLVQLPQVSLLPALELHQSLVASELFQRGYRHLCAQQSKGRLGWGRPRPQEPRPPPG